MPFAPVADMGKKDPEPVSEPETTKYMHAAAIGKNIYMEDARNALLEIPSELMRGKESLYDIIVKKNRLRGLGVLLVIIALFVAVSGVLR